MLRKIAVYVIVFALGIVIGVLACHLADCSPVPVPESPTLAFENLTLPTFSLDQNDIAIAACLPSDSVESFDQVTTLQQMVSANASAHLLLIWDQQIPADLPLSLQFVSSCLDTDPAFTLPHFFVVDPRYAILYQTSSISELEQYMTQR